MNFDARAKTYSNYKKHNTVKFLIGISPIGTISFLSQCWGGRVSDKILTQETNFYSLMEIVDTILADRCFTSSTSKLLVLWVVEGCKWAGKSSQWA